MLPFQGPELLDTGDVYISQKFIDMPLKKVKQNELFQYFFYQTHWSNILSQTGFAQFLFKDRQLFHLRFKLICT